MANNKNLLQQLWQYRSLTWQLAKREVIGRYRGSLLGVLWSFVNPVFMLAVYTFFFSIVYQTRWGTTGQGSKFDFALTLFAGLIPFSLFSECINRAPLLILNNVNYVKKVIFPLEILPGVSLCSALFHFFISFIVLLIFYLVIHHSLHWTIIFFPLVNLPLIFFILGLSWFLTSLGVFIRDIAHTTSIITTALLFLSPIFYSASAIPEPYRTFIYLNPLTTVIEQNRAVLIWGQLPNWSILGISLGISMLVAYLGYYWFRKTRHAFADVI